MPEIVFTGDVANAKGVFGPGDRLKGKEADLRPIVDCGSARWADEDPETGEWPLATPPEEYLERWPEGPKADLARRILGLGEGEE